MSRRRHLCTLYCSQLSNGYKNRNRSYSLCGLMCPMDGNCSHEEAALPRSASVVPSRSFRWFGCETKTQRGPTQRLYMCSKTNNCFSQDLSFTGPPSEKTGWKCANVHHVSWTHRQAGRLFRRGSPLANDTNISLQEHIKDETII